jgi:choline kinase
MGAPNDANYLCLDKGLINEEVFKIKADHTGAIRTLGAHVQVGEAAGATLGIEKITSKYCKSLFSTLHQLMADHKNWQEYYEYAFDHQIRNKTSSFKYVDVTGLKWVEMDTPEDYRLAKSYFGEAASRSPTKRSSRMAFPD